MEGRGVPIEDTAARMSGSTRPGGACSMSNRTELEETSESRQLDELHRIKLVSLRLAML